MSLIKYLWNKNSFCAWLLIKLQMQKLDWISKCNDVVQFNKHQNYTEFQICNLISLIWNCSTKFCLHSKLKVSRPFLKEILFAYTLGCKMFGPFCSVWCKMALAEWEVGSSLPWCHALVLLAPGYWRLFLNLTIFHNGKMSSFRKILGQNWTLKFH